MFDKLQWLPDRLVIDDLVLRMEHTKSTHWDGPEHLMFYKTDALITQYDTFFKSYSYFHPRHVVELGMWDGGSILFWNEVLKPKKIVGIDQMNREDSTYFKDYIKSQNLAGQVVTHWKTNQADKARLREIIASEFDTPLDFVIDDCSHLYGPTKASFEILFPQMSPGGWYLIEDWAWGHWPNYITPDHPWRGKTPLTEFVIELVKCAGNSPNLFSTLLVLPGFIAVQRGRATLDLEVDFDLDNYAKYSVKYDNDPSNRSKEISTSHSSQGFSKSRSLIKRIYNRIIKVISNLTLL